MLLYVIECKNSEQADEITTVLFKEALVIKAYKLENIKMSFLTHPNTVDSGQGALLLVLSKALLFSKIEEKVDTFPNTFLVGLPVSSINWGKVSQFLEKTQKV
jgi:hypothetical protein